MRLSRQLSLWDEAHDMNDTKAPPSQGEPAAQNARRRVDPSWDYAHVQRPTTYTHVFHKYPAAMLPEIAGRLIDEYGTGKGRLLDPYCGSGTSLVEASLRGLRAWGSDLNPLARFIATAKTTLLDMEQLEQDIRAYENFIASGTWARQDAPLPEFKNRDYWFAPDVQQKLASIRHFITTSVTDEHIRAFFFVALGETARESSWAKQSEFKLHRITPEKRAKFAPPVMQKMLHKLRRNQTGLLSYGNALGWKQPRVTICDHDTAKRIPCVPPESVDLVVTSPPYGDSRTTVAYGQYTRFSAQWIGLPDAMRVDRNLMGGRTYKEMERFGIPIADETIAAVARRNPKRAREVYSFYVDYRASIANVARAVRRGGVVCYVVGNRTVTGLTMPTDEITRAFFEAEGLIYRETIVRRIYNKKVASLNSPSNKPGQISATMSNEYIVIMEKP